MSKKRAEIRRAWRAGWMQWVPLNEDVEDRRVIAPLCDWPGATRDERRVSWRSAWRFWLAETVLRERELRREREAA